MAEKKETYTITEKARLRFKIWLLENNLTQASFADKCGVSRTYINDIVLGKRKITKSILDLFKKNGYELL